MKEHNIQAPSERELAAAKHLLASRAKQIKGLRESVAGHEETNRLLASFLPLLALAAVKEEAVGRAVRIVKGADTLGVSIEKAALAEILGAWRVKATAEDDAYRITFERRNKAHGSTK